MKTLFHDLAEYYGFDEKKYTPEDFFGDLKRFKDSFLVSSVMYTCVYFHSVSLFRNVELVMKECVFSNDDEKFQTGSILLDWKTDR